MLNGGILFNSMNGAQPRRVSGCRRLCAEGGRMRVLADADEGLRREEASGRRRIASRNSAHSRPINPKMLRALPPPRLPHALRLPGATTRSLLPRRAGGVPPSRINGR
eukprot:gene15059-biopygen6245